MMDLWLKKVGFSYRVMLGDVIIESWDYYRHAIQHIRDLENHYAGAIVMNPVNGIRGLPSKEHIESVNK